MRTTQTNNKRDWGIIILIFPLGVLLMLLIGQLAIRMSPHWMVEGDMNSLLDPETASKQDPLIVPPVSSDILTPVSWWDTFLTPSGDGGGVVFPPFITFEPSGTPSPTITPTTSSTPSPSPTVSPTVSPTKSSTPTKKPTDDDTSTPVITSTSTSTSTGTSTSTATSTSTGTATSTATPTGFPSTLVGTLVTTTPVNFNIGTPDDDGSGTGNGIGHVNNGNYVIIDLTSSPIIVNGTSDTNYDLAYYEFYRPFPDDDIAMDSVILSISSDGTTYYVVFNWGNGVPDNNSNVGDVAGAENDNQSVDSSELHDPDGAGSAPQTGILIDVDNAPSAPPPGSYQYLAIQAPLAPASDGNLDVDSIQVTEVPP